MKHSESLAKVAAALVAAQSEMRAVGRDRQNPHYKNSYATLDNILETVRPVLAKHGLAVVQGASVPTTDVEGRVVAVAVESVLVHASGEWIAESVVMPLDKLNPQGAGSAVTYGRRYSLSALLALATDEDDDGHAAVRPVTRADVERTLDAEPVREAPMPKGAPAPAVRANAAVPSCCGREMWSNVAENVERAQQGKSLRPNYVCKENKEHVIWPEKNGRKGQDTRPQTADVGAGDDPYGF